MPPKKKAANGYKFAEPLPKGIVLEDLVKIKWRLGPSIGKGGFGEIYCAQAENSKGADYPYVIKIEPHANGPLFVENNFYIRHAKPVEIEDFKKEKGLKTFGMPVYHGSGSLDYKGEKYRFLVMDKFSTDLYKLYMDNNKVFPVDTVFKLGIQILDVLEYIHRRGYVHADIKAANILLGATKETQNKQVYLVDFGLVTKYTMDKEFKPNPKKAHDGTIEFLSRDAHHGVQTRRGDLEILAYNLIQWLGCKLPWEGNLTDPKIVHISKEENMATVPKMIKASFGSKTPPKAIVEFLKYIKTLKFNTEPDYNKIRDIFKSGVKDAGGTMGTTLQFSGSKTPLKRNRTPVTNNKSKKTKLSEEDGNSEISGDEDKTPKAKRSGRTRKDVVVTNKEDVEMVIADSSNDEPNNSFITTRRPKNKKTDGKLNKKKSSSLQDLSNPILGHYNDAMKEVILTNDDNSTKKRRNHGQTNSKNSKLNKEENGDVSSDEELTPKPKKRGRSKKNLKVINEENSELAAVSSDEESKTGVNIKKKGFRNPTTKGKIGFRKSKSLDNLKNACEFEGYTDAMKEIILKKQKTGGRKNRFNTQKNQSSPSHDDMSGFTEEMKAIALKKKSKEKNGKKPSPVPIATTSTASDKRGLVIPTSNRLQRKSPRTQGEVATYYSDGSVSS